MGKIIDLRNNFAKLTEQVLEDQLLKIVKKNEAKFITANQEQLFTGVDSNNKFLKPPYASDFYANKKLTLNPLGVVDLKYTGAFYDGIFLQADKFPLYLFSRDSKTRKLVGQYGIELFGVDKKNLETIAKQDVIPEYQKFIKEAIHVP